jgi:hypothetical protein
LERKRERERDMVRERESKYAMKAQSHLQSIYYNMCLLS